MTVPPSRTTTHERGLAHWALRAAIRATFRLFPL